jgi:hypothetical protein
MGHAGYSNSVRYLENRRLARAATESAIEQTHIQSCNSSCTLSLATPRLIHPRLLGAPITGIFHPRRTNVHSLGGIRSNMHQLFNLKSYNRIRNSADISYEKNHRLCCECEVSTNLGRIWFRKPRRLHSLATSWRNYVSCHGSRRTNSL